MSPSPNSAAPAGRLAALTNPQTGLLLFMRLLSLVSLATGALHWGALLGLPLEPTPPFESMSLMQRVLTVYFAVLDPIAAVGLWLTSSWGAVLWLLSAVSRLALASGVAAEAGFQPYVLAYQCAMVGLYLFLSRRAAKAADA